MRGGEVVISPMGVARIASDDVDAVEVDRKEAKINMRVDPMIR
jgi:hypothetical protein